MIDSPSFPTARAAARPVAAAVAVLTALMSFAAPLGLPVVGAAAALGLTAVCLRALRWPRGWTPALAVAGAFLAWGLLSGAWSFDMAQTFKKTGQLAALVLMAGLLAAAAQALSDDARRQVNRATLVSGAALVVAVAAEGNLGLPYHTAVHALGWAKEVADYVLNRATLMMVLLSWPAAMAAAALGRLRLALALPVLAAAATTGLDSGTAGIAAVGGLIGGVVALAAGRLAAPMLAGLFAAGAAVVVPLSGHLYRWVGGWEALPYSLRHRFYIWEFSVDRIAERPLTGWGLDAARVMPNFGVDNLFVPGTSIIPLHTHNTYVQVMMETGLVGYVLLVGLTVWMMLRAGAWPRAERVCGLGLLCTVAAAWLTGYGAWQSWWLAGLVLIAFLAAANRRRSA